MNIYFMKQCWRINMIYDLEKVQNIYNSYKNVGDLF